MHVELTFYFAQLSLLKVSYKDDAFFVLLKKVKGQGDYSAHKSSIISR